MTEYDYIVVGAGSAGCAIAARLSEDATCSVAVIEAGGSDWSPVIMAPAATDLYGAGNPKWDWMYMAGADPSRHDRTEIWPRGKVLGGSSSINGTVYLRGIPGDFDAWEKAGNRGWGYEDVLPYFRKAESNEAGADRYRGGDGPVNVSDLRSVHPATRAFVEAATEMGIARSDDLNGAHFDAVGYNQVTQKRGWRHSSARAYLGPARRRPNLNVFTRAQTVGITMAGRRAVGITYVRSGEMLALRARREVILSAGVIGSPHLLMLSGIGPAAALKSQGIDVVHDLPAVGENLQDHCGLWMAYGANIRTYNDDNNLMGQAVQGLKWLLFGRGSATAPGCQATAFAHTRPGEIDPDVQLYFTPVGLECLPDGPKLFDESAVGIIPHVSRPKSYGRIRLVSADPFDHPEILPNLLGDDEDVRRLIDACKLARNLMTKTKALGAIVTGELGSLKSVTSDEEWEEHVRVNAVPIYQSIGTCRMGPGKESVVDERLRVHGIEGLRIADTSIIPSQISGCTNASAIMIGEKAAALIYEDWSNRHAETRRLQEHVE